MANLPYIEWFYMDGKKHLTLVKEPTHDYGTLYKMDEIAASEIKDKLINAENTACEVVIVTEDIKSTAAAYEKVTGMPLKPVSPGIYEHYKDKVRYIIVSKSQLDVHIKPGTYTIVSGNSGSISNISGQSVFINEREFMLFTEGGLHFLMS